MTQEEKLYYIESFNTIEKQYKDLEVLAKSLDRLLKNKDFKIVITEGYLKNEAVRLCENQQMFIKKSTPQNIEWAKEMDKLVANKLSAISHFRDYLEEITIRFNFKEKEYNEAREAYHDALNSTEEVEEQ